MNKILVLAVNAVAIAALYATSASAATEADLRDCGGSDLPRKLAGCTALANEARLSPKIRAAALYNRGLAHYARRDFKNAIADTKAALTLEPVSVAYYNQLGILFSESGDQKSAIDAYDRGISIVSTEPDLYYGRGQAHRILGDYQRAIADYSKAVDLGPRAEGVLHADPGKIGEMSKDKAHADYYVELAATFDAAGDHDRAMATYDEASRKFPKVVKVYAGRASSLAAHANIAGALADFDKAISLDPTNGEVFGRRGLVQFNLGDFVASAADFAKAQSFNPNSLPMPAEYRAIWIYITQMRRGTTVTGEPAPAVALAAARSNTTAWPAPVLRFLLNETTVDALLATATKREEQCEANFYIGQRRLIAGDKSAGLAALKTAFETCPKTFLEYTAAEAELKRSQN